MKAGIGIMLNWFRGNGSADGKNGIDRNYVNQSAEWSTHFQFKEDKTQVPRKMMKVSIIIKIDPHYVNDLTRC